MIIKQISALIEDRIGSSWQVFQTLADNKINILSYSINDEPDFGILRMIVDNTSRADEVLKQVGFRTLQTSVYCLNVPNETGSMSRVLRRLAEREVSIDYLYAFQHMGISQAIIHSKNMKLLEQVLTEYERELLNV